MSNYKDPSVCCPPFDPVPWEEKTIVWNEKPFITAPVCQLFHIPLPGSIARTVNKLWSAAEAAEAAPEVQDFLMLAHDPSPWRSDFYLAVTHPVAGISNVTLSGTFLTKVFDGPYRDVPKWIRQTGQYVAAKGHSVLKYYFYYTTCPKCAKKYGHNYVVIFAQVA